MNPDSENFDSLRQLLALKRHEIPPPGYFDRFSRDVMARIKSGDTGDELGVDYSWFRRFLRVFDVKPVFAGAFGTAVCAFLISGVLSSDDTPAGAAITPAAPGAVVGVIAPGMSDGDQQYASASNSVASRSLFDQFSLQATPVSDRFYLPNGN